METKQVIVWDLGATKCAAAVVECHAPQFKVRQQCKVKLCDYDSLASLTHAIEQQLQFAFQQADAICIAGAGQYNGTQLILDKGPNAGYPYPMTFAALAQQQRWPYFEVVHDYTPIVCRSFINDDYQMKTVVAGKAQAYGRRIAFGVGTGLGLKDAALLPDNKVWIGANEMGHIGLSHPPACQPDDFERHRELINFMYQHPDGSIALTFESILSGPGLALLHQFCENLSTRPSPEQAAIDIDQNPNCNTLALFATYLGLFIGTVQLSFMPSGGIWMNGGVLQKHPALFTEPFLSKIMHGISLSPAYHSTRQHIPVKMMLGDEHVLLGGAYYLHNCRKNVS